MVDSAITGRVKCVYNTGKNGFVTATTCCAARDTRTACGLSSLQPIGCPSGESVVVWGARWALLSCPRGIETPAA